jgi:formylglycine-generating enzyme required for sulfatase activity
LFCFLASSLPAAVDPASVDFDRSGTIDLPDLLVFFPAWLSHDGPSDDWNGACDISDPPDGVIDTRDLAALTVDWLIVIPEPNDYINIADINDDRVIDTGDLLVFFNAWLSDDSPSPNWNPACDIAEPNDGVINFLDFNVLASEWLATVPDPNDYVDVKDINGDGVVNFGDYVILSASWLADVQPMESWKAACDVAEPGDGLINTIDFAVLSTMWGFTLPDANEFAFIGDGQFEMGAHQDAIYAAQPVHTVQLDSFYMSRFQMTNERYCEFLNDALTTGMIKVEVSLEDISVYLADDTDNSHPLMKPYNPPYEKNNHIEFVGGLFSIRLKEGTIDEGTIDMTDHPVLTNWYGAAVYCNWKSETEGRPPCYDLTSWACDLFAGGYRLATEAEWEYAARGGLEGKRYPWGDTIDGAMANFEDSGDPFEGEIGGPYPYTTPVGYYNGGQTPAGPDTANGYGLYDMAGNIFEWCNDWFGYDYYQQCEDLGVAVNPIGPVEGTERVKRGGSWNITDTTRKCQVDYRNDDTAHDPANFSGSYGFRICLPAP